MKRQVVVVLAVAVVSMALGQGAHASTGRFTHGDAQRVLNNYPPGNKIDDELGVGLDIRPFQEFYGDIPYCVDDWHVLALLWDDYEWALDFGDGSPLLSNTQSDVREFLSGLTMQFLLDGVPVEARQRPIKPYLAADLGAFEEFIESELGGDATVTSAWAVQWGRVLAPGELGVGTHTFDVVVTHPDPAFPSPSLFSVTFTVGASDSAACTEGGTP